MFRLALFSACLSFLLVGCLPSFVPLSKKNEATPEGLTGVWLGEKFEYAVELNDDHYSIYGKSLNPKETPDVPYLMVVSKIGDKLYASVAFDYGKAEASWPKEIKNQLECNVYPQVWIFRLKLEGDTLKMLIYDDKVVSLPKDGDDGESFPSPIAADRKALREWISKNGAKAFKEHENFIYKRKTADSK